MAWIAFAACWSLLASRQMVCGVRSEQRARPDGEEELQGRVMTLILTPMMDVANVWACRLHRQELPEAVDQLAKLQDTHILQVSCICACVRAGLGTDSGGRGRVFRRPSGLPCYYANMQRGMVALSLGRCKVHQHVWQSQHALACLAKGHDVPTHIDWHVHARYTGQLRAEAGAPGACAVPHLCPCGCPSGAGRTAPAAGPDAAFRAQHAAGARLLVLCNRWPTLVSAHGRRCQIWPSTASAASGDKTFPVTSLSQPSWRPMCFAGCRACMRWCRT